MELSPADLRTLETAASNIPAHGARYPEELQKLRALAMTNVLILDANGQIACFATDLFLRQTDVRLTLYLRNSRRLKNPDPARVRIVDGDVLDQKVLPAWLNNRDNKAIHDAQY